MVRTFFIAGDRCEVTYRAKSGAEVTKLGTVSKFTYPWMYSPNGCVEGIFDDGGAFCGDGGLFKKRSDLSGNNCKV